MYILYIYDAWPSLLMHIGFGGPTVLPLCKSAVIGVLVPEKMGLRTKFFTYNISLFSECIGVCWKFGSVLSFHGKCCPSLHFGGPYHLLFLWILLWFRVREAPAESAVGVACTSSWTVITITTRLVGVLPRVRASPWPALLSGIQGEEEEEHLVHTVCMNASLTLGAHVQRGL